MKKVPVVGAFAIFALLVLASLLSGCSSPAGVDNTEPAATATEDLPPEASVTAPATAPPGVILVAGQPDEVPILDLQELLNAIERLGRSAGLSYRQTAEQANSPDETVVAVVSLGDGPVDAILHDYPDRPILTLTEGRSSVEQDNVSNLYYPSAPLERQAMLAGYVAALITKDWRVAIITATDEGSVQANARAGAVYMCGLCRPNMPPYADYPLSFQLESGASQGEINELAADLQRQAVSTVVLSPETASDELVRKLEETGTRMIGLRSQPASRNEFWAASIRYQLQQALDQVWASFLAGEPLSPTTITLGISDRSPMSFTDARLRLALDTAQKINDGLVSPAP